MAWSLIANVAGGNSSQTSAINCTGANLIVIWQDANNTLLTPVDFIGGVPTGNVYTLVASYADLFNIEGGFYYCSNPTVGANQTFLAGSSPSDIAVSAWSGAATSSPSDKHNGAGGIVNTGSSFQPGSITPSVNNCLVLTGTGSTASALVAPSGYTGIYAGPGVWVTLGLAYQIQTTATATNPTWTFTNAEAEFVVAIASFLPGSGFTAVNRRSLGPRVGSRSVN